MDTCHPRADAPDVVPASSDPHLRADFGQMLRRYRLLARSLNAADQRERDRLSVPLMHLYLELNPRSAYRHYDDIETVLRRDTTR